MGLVWVALNWLKPVEMAEDHERNWPRYTIANPERFEAWLDPLEQGRVYLGLEGEKRHLGSYRYYGEWRSWMARTFAGVESLNAVRPGAGHVPFLPMLYFPDNEGFLGARAVESLRDDFAYYEDQVDQRLQEAVEGGEAVWAYRTTWDDVRAVLEAAHRGGSLGAVMLS